MQNHDLIKQLFRPSGICRFKHTLQDAREIDSRINLDDVKQCVDKLIQQKKQLCGS